MARFSLLQRDVLRFINKSYSIPWNPSDSKRIVAVCERPLPTMDLIYSRFRSHSNAHVADAVEYLKSYQCIVPVYLYGPTDYSEVVMVPGERARFPVGSPESGVHALQITVTGQKTIAEFARERFITVSIATIGKMRDAALTWIFAFFFGMAISATLGLDVKDISFGPLNLVPSQRSDQIDERDEQSVAGEPDLPAEIGGDSGVPAP